MQKPFLKWVGGKTQLLEKIIKYIPNKFNDYHEIFLGGGSMLFQVLHLKQNKIINCNNIYAYDYNKTLINLYTHIQSQPVKLHEILDKYVNQYKSINIMKGDKADNIENALKSQESYYYWVRSIYNRTDDELLKSALFVFLNKTCFRGLYREGPNGFNVPFGHYKTSAFPTLEELDKISVIIKDVVFQHMDFKESMQCVQKGDFCYLDPPYYPTNPKSFTKYTKNDFSNEQHTSLFNLIKKIGEDGVLFLFSNSAVKEVQDSFQNYNVIRVDARRAINSKNPAAKTQEVLIHNLV